MSKRATVQSGGLPARWRRNRLIAAVVTFVLVGAVLYPLRAHGRADDFDLWWLTRRFTFREQVTPTRAPDPDIVLVELDDYSVGSGDTAAWHEPSIAWNPHIAKTLDILRLSGARAIGIDRIQPERTYQWLKAPPKGEPDNDEILLHSLSQTPIVVWAKEYHEDSPQPDRPGDGTPVKGHEHGHWILPWDQLISVIPGAFADSEPYMGYANFPKRGDVVTAIDPAFRTDPTEESFAARIAEMGLGTRGRLEHGAWVLPGRARLALRDDDTALIDFAPGLGGRGATVPPFSVTSMRDLVSRRVGPDPRFRGKFVLIGTSFGGDPDTHFIPVTDEKTGRNRLLPGVEIQANILQNLLRGRALAEPHGWQIWLIAVGLSGCAVLLFLRLNWLRAALAALLLAAGWIALSFALFTQARFALPINLPLTGLALSGGLMGGYIALSEERERRQVMGLWGQYQDPRLVSFLLQNETARGGQGQEMEVTVLFADLKNFTKTVQHLSPTEAITVLNRYLGMLDAVIRKHGGVVDKYLGDGLMAQWGAPAIPGEALLAGHAEAALRACLEIQREAELLAVQEAASASSVGFELRLTLHTGPVVFGWVGAKRLELTIIGDTVNVTSRLQETAKQLGVDFLVSESTYARVREHVTTGQEAEVEIRGRDRPLRVYEIVGEKG